MEIKKEKRNTLRNLTRNQWVYCIHEIGSPGMKKLFKSGIPEFCLIFKFWYIHCYYTLITSKISQIWVLVYYNFQIRTIIVMCSARWENVTEWLILFLIQSLSSQNTHNGTRKIKPTLFLSSETVLLRLVSKLFTYFWQFSNLH